MINIEFDSDNSELEYMVVVSRNSDGNISACEQLLSLDEKNQNKSIAYYSNNSITVETNGLNQKYQILDTKGFVDQSLKEISALVKKIELSYLDYSELKNNQ